MKKTENLIFKMTLYFKKTGNHFESYIGKTRKEVEQAVRDRKKEMKNWADDEPRPMYRLGEVRETGDCVIGCHKFEFVEILRCYEEEYKGGKNA